MLFFKRFKLINKGKSRTYLDYASSTPLDMSMIRAIPKIPVEVLGANPGALHREGVLLAGYVRDARSRVSRSLGVQADEIIFTSGATESDNLAIVGLLQQWQFQGIPLEDIVVISSALEHAAVAEAIESFTARGVQHTIMPLGEGVVDPKHLMIPPTAKAVLVTVMYVSNEIGTVQPIALLAKRIRKLRKELPEVIFVFHTDATQAPCHAELRIPSLGVDMMTLGATKLYSHKGVGLLYKRRSLSLKPLAFGGGQEQGLRPGTVPVELVHEFSYALEKAVTMREAETARVSFLRDYFETTLLQQFPAFRITGASHPRSPHISHVAIPGFDSELLVLELDARGIAVSAKSACSNSDENESSIVETLYGAGWGAVRVSFGRMTTKRDIDKLLKAFASVFRKYNRL